MILDKAACHGVGKLGRNLVQPGLCSTTMYVLLFKQLRFRLQAYEYYEQFEGFALVCIAHYIHPHFNGALR